MTRESMLLVVRIALRRNRIPNDFAVANEIVDAVEAALEADQGEVLTGNGRARPGASEAPASPAVISAASPVVQFRTGATAAAPSMDAKHRMITVAKEDGIAGLLDALHRVTPPTMAIEVEYEGKMVPITLQRNIVAGAGFEAAKVVYKHASADETLEASKTFFVGEPYIDVTRAMEELTEQAVKLYSPRKPIEVTAPPHESGILRFETGKTPHAEV